MASHMYLQYTIQWNLLLYKLLWTSEGPLDCKYANSTPSAHKRALRVFRNHTVDTSAPPTLFTTSESTISDTPHQSMHPIMHPIPYPLPSHSQPHPYDSIPATPSAIVTRLSQDSTSQSSSSHSSNFPVLYLQYTDLSLHTFLLPYLYLDTSFQCNLSHKVLHVCIQSPVPSSDYR